MQIKGRVSFQTPEVRKHFVQAFFSEDEFSIDNELIISNDQACIRIVFDSIPPQGIIDAISDCDINELSTFTDEQIKAIPRHVRDGETEISCREVESEKDEQLAVDGEKQEANAAEQVSVGEDKREAVKAEQVVNGESKHEADEQLAVDEEKQEANVAEQVVDDESESEAGEAEDIQLELTVAEDNVETLKSEENEGPTKDTLVEYHRSRNMMPSENDYIRCKLFEDASKEKEFTGFIEKVNTGLGFTDVTMAFHFETMCEYLDKGVEKAYLVRRDDLIKANVKANENTVAIAITKLGKKVNEAMRHYGVNVSLLNFIITLVYYYKKYHGKIEVESSSANTAEANKPKKVSREKSKKARTKKSESKMKTEIQGCEILKYQAYKDIIASIDAKAKLHNKVCAFYEKMGVKSTRPIFRTLVRVTEAAFGDKQYGSINDLMEYAGYSAYTNDGIMFKKEFADIINTYNAQHDIPNMDRLSLIQDLKLIFT